MKTIETKTVAQSYEKIMQYMQWNKQQSSCVSIVKTEDGKDTWQSIPLTIVISDPCNPDWYHPKSPFGTKFYEEYIAEVLEGKNAGRFDYDYYTRLFNHDVNTNTELMGVTIPDNDWCKGHLTVIQTILKQRTVNQIKYIIDKLNRTPTSRRALAITWEPFIDENTMNVPCLQYIQFWITDNRLNMYVTFRSEDMLMGYPANVVGLINIMMYIANQVNVKCGTYYHSVVVPHVYVSDKSLFDIWAA